MNLTPAANTSSAIQVIRPVLILFMMLAHLFVLDDQLILRTETELTLASWLTVFLKKALAKSGVPLLSLISGYLAVYSLEKYGYVRLLGRKVKRLVWPLIWANLIFILLITYPVQATDPGYRTDLSINPFDACGWFQAIFAFYRLPANEPLFFLKDLFTCFLLLPLLIGVARVRYVNYLVILWMAWKCIYLKSAFLFEVYPLWFLRFDIVFAFYIGIMLFQHGSTLALKGRRLIAAVIAAFLAVAAMASCIYVLYAKGDRNTLFLWLDFLVKASSVIACIGLMNLLNESRGRVSAFFRRLSPYAFSMFLTHAISFRMFHDAWLYLFGSPRFFAPSGIAYIVLILAVATLVAVLSRIAWGFIIARLRAATGFRIFADVTRKPPQP